MYFIRIKSSDVNFIKIRKKYANLHIISYVLPIFVTIDKPINK